MTIELEAALTVLRGRVEDTLSALPPSAAERRNPENGVVVPMGALDAVLDALSSPPADDVREALVAVLDSDGPWKYTGTHTTFSAERGADAILADPRFEVRLRGTVTEEATDV